MPQRGWLASSTGKIPMTNRNGGHQFEDTSWPDKAASSRPQPPLQGQIEDVDFVSAAADALRSTVDAAAAQVTEVASNVGDELAAAVDVERQRGAETVKSFARAIKRAGEELTDQSPLIGRTFGSAARSIEHLSSSIKSKSVRELFDEVSGLAQRRPVAFIGGAVFAGFVVARFLRSSSVAVTAVSQPDSSTNGSA